MADLSKIKLNGVAYNLKDATARESIASLAESLDTIHDPEENSDVQTMLLSYGLTVATETNGIVGTAITGKAIAQWSLE